jgi:hypothetical protein
MLSVILCLVSLVAVSSKVEGKDSALVGTMRIAGETLVGAAGGTAFAIAVDRCYLFKGGANPYQEWRKGKKGEFIGNLAADYTATALGSSIGVYLVGVIGNETGSFLEEIGSFGATFGISALSAMLFFTGCVFPDMRSDFRGYGSADMDPWMCCIVPSSWGFITIGAVIGFNATRNLIVSGESEEQEGQKGQAAPALCLNLMKVRF